MKAFTQHTLWALGLALTVTSMALSGCGSNDGGGGSGTTLTPGIVTPIAPAQVNCPAGQVNTAYGCLQTASCASIHPGYGWLPGENQCVPPIGPSVGTSTSGNFFGAISIVDKTTFELFLQNTGQCSRNVIGWNWGAANCQSYSAAGYMYLQTGSASAGMLPTQATVTIGAGSTGPNFPNSSGWTTGTLRVPFYSPLAYANANQGFTGTGPYGLRFVVDQGLPGNSYQLSVKLQYNGVTFALANLVAQ